MPVMWIAFALGLVLQASAQKPAPEPGADAAEELIKNREQMQQQLAPLNAANPFADGVSGPSGAPAVAVTGPMSQVLQVLQHPATQAYLRIFSQPKIQETALKLKEHPNRLNLLYSEIAWVLGFLVFRAWRRGKAKTLAGRLWVGLYTLLLGTLIGGVLLPYLWLGDDFLLLATACLEAGQEAISVLIQAK